jgi:CO/xanthine dehydrogenase Mo-binding subunit
MYHAINKAVPRLDVWEKVNGTAKYGADLYFDGMLYAKGVYAEYPHAKILHIDTEAARSAEGVEAVITAKDIPGLKVIGEVMLDQYILADDKTRFFGDVVACVAARTPEQAAAAAKLVQVAYEPLPGLYDTETAENNETIVTSDYPGNVVATSRTCKGDAEAALAQCDVVVDTHYSTQFVEHAYIEPEAMVVLPGFESKRLTVYGSLQNPYMVRLSVCRSLNLPMAKVDVVQCALGGTFGGKLESVEPLAVRAGLIALMTGKPVKYVLTREESIRESYKRHPFRFHVRLGASRDGTLQAMHTEAAADSGAYANWACGVIGKASHLGPGPYRNPNVLYNAKAIATNNIHTGSMRGFGTPQAIYATENAMDELAEKLGMSPLELRRKNALRTGDISGTGQVLDKHEVTVLRVLNNAAAAIGYEEKYEKYNRENHGLLRRGVGIACSMRGVSIGSEGLDVARVYIEIEEDASVLVSCGYTEQGQGLRTALAQIAAEAIGCGLERITMNPADSSRAPSSGAAIASRGTFTGGNAICDAARTLHGILAAPLAEKYGVAADTIHFENDFVTAGGRTIPFPEAVALCYGAGATPAANGTFVNYPLHWDHEKCCGEAFVSYTYSCHAAEVEVDLTSGRVTVLKMAGSHDAGRVINPTLACGQVFGGMVMGAGMGLTEDLASRNGICRNLNFDNYVIPTFMDVGENEAIMVDDPDPRGPFGAKSLGEPATEPGAAAVACAVNHALRGIGRLHELPFGLEAVFFCGGEGIKK